MTARQNPYYAVLESHVGTPGLGGKRKVFTHAIYKVGETRRIFRADSSSHADRILGNLARKDEIHAGILDEIARGQA